MTGVGCGAWAFANDAAVNNAIGNPGKGVRLESDGAAISDPTLAQTVAGLTMGDPHRLSWDLDLRIAFGGGAAACRAESMRAAGIERQRQRRPSMLDPYLAFITETLEQFPTLSAARLFDMAVARGYPGGADNFRHRIAQLRPPSRREAYLRLRTLPGEQAQVDWTHFGTLSIGRAERPLMAFVMVLSYSRHTGHRTHGTCN